MRSFKEIKENYAFGPEDEERLRRMKPLMEGRADEVLGALHVWIMSNRATARFFSDETRQRHVFGAQRKWFLDLFSGRYDHGYYERLIKIGKVHVTSGVDAHFMNRAINVVRNACVAALAKAEEDPEEKATAMVSFEKLLDINLDVVTSSYIQEELRRYSSVYKVKSRLVDFSEKFTQTANLVLVIALIGLTVGAVALFYRDVRGLFNGPLERGIISALGSLLILWVMVELMNTEIAHLKGERFKISIFVGVALVTIIRETMIATLKHEDPGTIYYLIAAILVIGVVYWLVARSEERLR
ncbi:MAG: protoglobin domain-containing protein [Thermodesulfovibrionales bacterium]